MKKIPIVLFIACITALTLLSTAYSIFIIESQRTYPEVPTVDDDFAFCVQIKKDHPCMENTIQTTYLYGLEEGELYPLKEYINRYHFKLDELPQTYIWCGKVTSTNQSGIGTNFTCLDTLNNPRSDYHWNYISNGNIYIYMTSSFENELIFGKDIGEQIEIVTYLEVAGDFDMYYTAYNVSGGIIPFIVREEMTKIEGQYRVNFTIPAESPYGFIVLEVENDFDKGGKFLSYAARPYSSEITVDGDAIMGKTIDIGLEIDIEYGTVNNVNTIVILPNGTEEVIYLDHINISTEYTIPMRPGNYTIESTINHTIQDDKKTIENFYVKEYELDIDSGIKVYEQEDRITIKVGVINSDDSPIDMEIDSICIGHVEDDDEDCFEDSDMIIENKYYKLVYVVGENAETGEYSVRVSATDEYNLEYTGNESFTVQEKDETLQFRVYPSIFYKKINSMTRSETKYTITNTGTATIEDIIITIDSGELSDYITINKINFMTTVQPGNSTTFKVIIQPDDDMENKLYYGNVSIESDGEIHKIHVTLDVSLTAEMSLVNKTIEVEALKDKEKNIYVVIENAGTLPLKNITASLTGDLKEYEDKIEPPYEIIPGKRKNIEITLNPISKTGIYKGELEINAVNASGIVEITVEVIEDFKDKIDDVDGKRKTMNMQLSVSSGDTRSIEEDLIDLQTDITEMRSYYNNGQYKEAKSMLTGIQSRAERINTALEQLESTEDECGDGVCDDSETCTSCHEDCKNEPECIDTVDDDECDYDDVCDWDDGEGCTCDDCEYEDDCMEDEPNGDGGSPILIIIVLIVVVVIVAVIATSVVPDDKVESEALTKL